MRVRVDRGAFIGLGVVAVSAVLFWLANRGYDAGRGDFYYLADAFLHGRIWLDLRLGPWDVITQNGRYYVPFAPFPAIALMPLVAVMGAVGADHAESGINALLAAASVGMCWWLMGRLGVRRLSDRAWLTILFGFSTQILWVTTRGGVWHTGHLVATILTLGCLLEVWGKRRAWVVGLLAGAAFLTRAPVAFAIPFYALLLMPTQKPTAEVIGRRGVTRLADLIPWRNWVLFGLGIVPSIAFFLWYNASRFGSPLESGYALASLPPFLEAQRARGLFSPVHLGMNLDYLLIHLPSIIPNAPFFRPDGLGMSVFLTSPGLLLALRADWRRRSTWLLGGAAIAVLIPSLLYYGGGWLQYGYRYFLDSTPFVITLCGLAAVHRGTVSWPWKAAIAFGTLVMEIGVYWAYNF